MEWNVEQEEIEASWEYRAREANPTQYTLGRIAR